MGFADIFNKTKCFCRSSDMAKINKELLPIKAHYFFFMASELTATVLITSALLKILLFLLPNSGLGPILPQINVFGRQLGVSPSVMGKTII